MDRTNRADVHAEQRPFRSTRGGTVHGADDEQFLEVLDEDECLRLLRTAVIGRLAFTEGALPAIQPVSFLVDGGRILIPTRFGSKVAAASRGAVVAFEVDEFDPVDHTGWNVTVVGPSRVIADPAEVAGLDALGARPWAPADRYCYIAIPIRLVRGRRVSRRPNMAAGAAAHAPAGAVTSPV
jgi:hypothetical protein